MKKFSSPGQSFVEYALILLLVAMAVISVLAIFGPALAQTYRNVTNNIANPISTPTPVPWTFCSNEYRMCNFVGTKEIRYGKHGTWVYGTFTNQVFCDNSVFGDPLVGTLKECDYR